MKKNTISIIFAIVFVLSATITFAQNKSIELNNGVLNELMEAGGFDTTQISWSIETWVKVRTFDGVDESHFVEPWTGGAGETCQLYFNPTTHTITTNGNAYSFGGLGETEILADTWYHIAMTVDGVAKTFTVYLNGEEELSGASNENQLQTSPKVLDSLVIGHFRGLGYDADWGATQGKFDEVRLWYKALTQAEVQANMNKAITSGDGLEAVWNFDGSDINTDATGNGHDLISGGRVDASNLSDDAPALESSGGVSALEKSLELNNGVLNELMEAGGFDTLQTNWSLETWVKFRTFAGVDESHFLEGWAGLSGEMSQFYIDPTNHVLTTRGNSYSFGVVGTTEIMTDKWYHIAFVVDGDNGIFTAYLNGEEELTGPSNGNVNAASPTMFDSVVVGHFRGLAYDADWGATQGKFDEVRVWYKALTQEEVKANMNKAITSGDGLAAVWNFNDSTNIGLDATGNGHDLISGGRVDASNLSDDVPSGLVGVEKNSKNGTPEEFQLSQNYPNPFNPTTVISFTLKNASHVKLDVYNVIGEKVAELINSNLSTGVHSVNFNAADLTSGIYFYKISAGDFVAIKKMMLLK